MADTALPDEAIAPDVVATEIPDVARGDLAGRLIAPGLLSREERDEPRCILRLRQEHGRLQPFRARRRLDAVELVEHHGRGGTPMHARRDDDAQGFESLDRIIRAQLRKDGREDLRDLDVAVVIDLDRPVDADRERALIVRAVFRARLDVDDHRPVAGERVQVHERLGAVHADLFGVGEQEHHVVAGGRAGGQGPGRLQQLPLLALALAVGDGHRPRVDVDQRELGMAERGQRGRDAHRPQAARAAVDAGDDLIEHGDHAGGRRTARHREAASRRIRSPPHAAATMPFTSA